MSENSSRTADNVGDDVYVSAGSCDAGTMANACPSVSNSERNVE